MTAERNVCQDLTLEALYWVVPPETIPAVLLQTETQLPRMRALTAQVPIAVLIAMNLSTPPALGHVLRKVAHGLRFLWPDPPYRVPGAPAFVYRRSHLGAPLLVVLDERLARPLAPPHTPGACRCGVHLRGIDGPVEDVPATPATAAASARLHGSRGDSALPPGQGVTSSRVVRMPSPMRPSGPMGPVNASVPRPCCVRSAPACKSCGGGG
jgi:hypothetical protein